jgi:hypothetical protein
MDTVYEFIHAPKGKPYSIQIVRGPARLEVQVHPVGSTDLLYSYPLQWKSYESKNVKKVRIFCFFWAGKAFDFVNDLN